MICVELFAGAGGAALGLELAGFRHGALVEWDADACATMRRAGLRPVIEGDVRKLEIIEETVAQGFGYEPVTLLWSSFPCQAWSVAGARKGSADDRNGWPWTVDAIDRLKPKWFLAENVQGLTFHKRVNKKPCPGKQTPGAGDPSRCPGCYLDMVIIPQLRERFAHAGYWVLDAADFGVPQHRRRLVIWAGPEELEAPQPTHGPKAEQPWVSMGEALGMGDFIWDSMRNTEANPRQERPTPSSEPAPTVGGRGNQMVRRVIGGGRDWRGAERRRLTVEECAILQGFPEDYVFCGTTKKSRFQQVGNAVPPTLAEVVGRVIAAKC